MVKVKQKRCVKVSYNGSIENIPISHSFSITTAQPRLHTNGWVTKWTNFPLPVNELKIPSETYIGEPFITPKGTMQNLWLILWTFCTPLCCSVRYCGQRVPAGGDHPHFGKTSCEKTATFFFFFMSPGSCLRTLDLCQNKIVHPSPKRAAWLGRFLVLPDQQKGRKNGRINRNTANSYHLICSLSLLQAHTDPLALSNLTQTYTLACTRSLLFGSQYGGHCFIPSVTFKCPINCQLEKCPIVFHPENPHPSQIQALRAHFEYVFNFWIQTGELFMPWLLYDLS